MIDREIIPPEQYSRLLIQTDHRGQVTSAQVIDNSLLAKWIKDELLDEHHLEVTHFYQWAKARKFGFLGAKTMQLDGKRGESWVEVEPYSDIIREVGAHACKLLDDFLAAHRADAKYFYNQVGEIQETYRKLTKVVDAIR